MKFLKADFFLPVYNKANCEVKLMLNLLIESNSIMGNRSDAEDQYLHLSWHEAGHALAFAIFGGNLPDDIQVEIWIEEQPSGNFFAKGNVKANYLSNTEYESEEIDEYEKVKWEMINLLLGHLADNFGTQSADTSDSKVDNDTWRILALRYLSIQEKDEFSEAGKIFSLRKDQTAIAKDFLEKNSHILEKLQNELFLKGALGRKELLSFFTNVIFPESFPKPIKSLA